MDMDLDCALTDTEGAGNLFIRQTGCREPCYLILTVGELHHFTSCLLERTRSDSLGIRIHAYEFAPNRYYMPPRSPAALP